MTQHNPAQLLANTLPIRQSFASSMEDSQIQDADSYIEHLGDLMDGELDLAQGLFVVDMILQELELFVEEGSGDEPGVFIPGYLLEDGSPEDVKQLIMQLQEWVELVQEDEDVDEVED